MKSKNTPMLTKGITNRQLFFLLFLTITASANIQIAKEMAQTAGRSGWIVILPMSLVYGIFAAMIAKMNALYPGRAFYDYNRDIAGKYISYILGIYFVLHLITVGVFLKINFLGMLSSNFLPKTPQYEMLFFSILLFAFVANKGITNIARLIEIYGILFLVTTVLICIIMLAQGMEENILPLFNPNDVKQFASTFWRLVMPLGGIEVLLIIPLTKKNIKAPKTVFFAYIFVGVFYVLIVESTIMILGINNTMVFNDPFIEAIKIAQAPIIERLDVFYLTFGLTSVFACMIVVFAAIVEFATKLFPKIKRTVVVAAIALVLYVLTLFALQIKDITSILEGIFPCMVIFAGFIVPTVMFIVAKTKKKTAVCKEYSDAP